MAKHGVYVGIDPGKSGGIAILSTVNGLRCYTLKKMTLGDINDVFTMLPPYDDDRYIVRAVLEEVHSMPRDGRVGLATFMRSFGNLEAMLTAHEIEHKLVTPQKWQRVMRCLTGGDKNVTKAAAQRLFPGVKVTHAIADAMLLAKLCEEKWELV